MKAFLPAAAEGPSNFLSCFTQATCGVRRCVLSGHSCVIGVGDGTLHCECEKKKKESSIIQDPELLRPAYFIEVMCNTVPLGRGNGGPEVSAGVSGLRGSI